MLNWVNHCQPARTQKYLDTYIVFSAPKLRSLAVITVTRSTIHAAARTISKESNIAVGTSIAVENRFVDMSIVDGLVGICKGLVDLRAVVSYTSQLAI